MDQKIFDRSIHSEGRTCISYSTDGK